MKISHELIHLQTQEPLEFVELTERVAALVHQSAVHNGVVNIQTQHTTTGIIVNEAEPLLLEDMKKALEKFAPSEMPYQHDDFTIRTVNLCPEERKNGHSHCKSLALGSSETLNIRDGAIQFGRWQRLFFVELDGGRKRTISVMIMGI